MALRIAGVHPSCECTLSANCYCSTRSHVCFFSEKGRFIQTIQVSSRILFDNLCLSETSFIINTYIILKKKSIKKKAESARISRESRKSRIKLATSLSGVMKFAKRNKIRRREFQPSCIYLVPAAAAAVREQRHHWRHELSLNPASSPTLRTHARTHARTQPRVPRKRARERSETDAMRCTVPYSRHCPYNVPLSQFLSPFFALRRRFTRQPTFVGTNGRLHPFEIKI